MKVWSGPSDRPIIFSGEMVRAILDGRKTQTRRVISTKPRKTRPNLFDGSWSDSYVLDPDNRSWREDEYRWRVGARLWVRESLTIDDTLAWRYAANDTAMRGPAEALEWADRQKRDNVPAIHMPRWASRLTLIVEEVKVERLQDISEADAIAEGIWRFGDHWKGAENQAGTSPQAAFAVLWNSINGKRQGCAWNDNPWIVAVSFRTIKANIDALPAHLSETTG